MFLVKLNYFVNKNYERPEIFVTEKQAHKLIDCRNNDHIRDYLITVDGCGLWFAPKDILSISELSDSEWWENEAPDYYHRNVEKERANSKAKD